MEETAELGRLGVWQPELAELARLLGAARMPPAAREAATLLLDRWPRGARAPQPALSSGAVTVATRDLAYRYRAADPDAVRGISLELHQGEITAIVGANGAGKSTLGLLIAGALRPSHGAVSVRGDVAYVFQYPERGFLATTVRQEIGYAARVGGPIARHPQTLIPPFMPASLPGPEPPALLPGAK